MEESRWIKGEVKNENQINGGIKMDKGEVKNENQINGRIKMDKWRS